MKQPTALGRQRTATPNHAVNVPPSAVTALARDGTCIAAGLARYRSKLGTLA